MSAAPSVFLIDDDRDLRKAMQQTLELAGFTVSSFASATEALAELSADFAGIVISDIRMPGMDGLALFGKVLALDPDLPMILVTGHGDIPMAVQAIRTAPMTSSPSRLPPIVLSRAPGAQRRSGGSSWRTGRCAARPRPHPKACR